MRKSMLILLMFLLSVLPARAADAPAYTVAFGREDGIRVATLAADGTVGFDYIPRGYFKQGGTSLIAPAWTNDSRTLYYSSATSDHQDDYINVYAYDRFTRKTTPVVFLKQSEGNSWTSLNLSPDGRYLWLSREFFSNHLIDTQAPPDKRVVAMLDSSCPGDLIGWAYDKLYASGMFACQGSLVTIDIATGTISKTPAAAWDDVYLSVGWDFFPAKTHQILAGKDNKIIRVSFDTPETSETVAQGQYLAVSGDSQIAIFWKAGKFYRINPTTGNAEAVFDGAEPNAQFTAKDQVGYWTLKDKTLSLITFGVDGAKTVEFALPDAGAELDAAWDRPLITLLYREQNKLLMYSSGGQTFDSTTLPDDLRDNFELPSKDDDSNLTWWLDWYFVDGSKVTTDPVKKPRFVVNAATGQRMDIPQPITSFSGTSPDGVWWLFACTDYGTDTSLCGKMPTLIAVNAMTGKSVTLSDDAYLEEINFHFSPMAYYAWAQP